MEELAAAPRRAARRPRKAAGAAAARAAYGDVFGGPPRFAAPFAGVPEDYAEVFGGVAASCSIPFLDIPPAEADLGGGGGAGDYREIFGRFDFGEFALSYEELFEDVTREGEEIASSSGSSRSSSKRESSQLEAEPSTLLQNYPNEHHDQHFEEDQDQFSPISFPSNGGQYFNVSYNKASRGACDDSVGTTTCVAEPLINFVVDSCNSSHSSETNHIAIMDNGTTANGEKEARFPPSSASAGMKSSGEDFIAGQKQHMQACPVSGNGHANENPQKNSSSNNSAPSDEAPSLDYPFLRVTDFSLQTRPVKVPPPSRPPPKLLNKQDSTAKEGTNLVKHKDAPTSSGRSISGNSVLQVGSKADPPSFDLDVNPTSAASAAMKEAMEFAEARLKAAKELMEGKGESFKLRKRPGHHRSTKSMEIREGKTPEEVHTSEEKPSRSAKEDKNYEDPALSDKHGKVISGKLAQCDDKERRVLPVDEPQQMTQSGIGSYQAFNKLEKLGKWRSGDEFYELISHDEKCKSNVAVREEDNGKRTNPASKLSKDQKGKTGASAGDNGMERYEKLWEDNDSSELEFKHVNLREDCTTCIESEGKAPTIVPEASTLTQSIANEEGHDSHFELLLRAGNAQGNHGGGDDEKVVTPEIPLSVDCVQDMPSSFSEAHISGDKSSDLRNLCNLSSEEGLVVGMSQEDKDNKEGLRVPSVGETICTSGWTEKLQESPEISNLDDIQGSQVKTVKFEEAAECHGSQAFQSGLNTSDGESETFQKEKLFNFGNEACLQNENEQVTAPPIEVVIYKGVEKFEPEEKGCLCQWDTECPEKENGISLENSRLTNEHEEFEDQNVFVAASKVIKSNSRKSSPFDTDPDQFQEMQSSSESQELGKTEAAIAEVCESEEKAAKETSLEDSKEADVEGMLNHGSREDQTAKGTDIDKGSSGLYGDGNVAHDGDCNVTLQSRVEFISGAANDVPMKVSRDSKDQHASFSEMCSSMHHSSQSARSVSVETSKETTPGLLVNEEEKEKQKELLTEKSMRFEERQSGSKMEQKEDIEKVANVELKDQQSPHSGISGTLPELADDNGSAFVETSKKDAPGVQIAEEENRRKIEREMEKEKKVTRRLEEEKERERKLEKEREQAKERERRKLEEEKEREREREKDRLAVERATREAHERAFTEARERAERIALERITAARQRASAEARDKEEKASAEAAAEKASREARIKAERAAVERATAEARERAIEKAKAEKAAADARERMERFRSSFKDSFKAANQDIRQDTQFQRTTSNNYGRNTDYSNQVVEVESALRHKARLERHQRTAERAAKALAEKNLRDMLAQREQAEKHRLAEFLDPEVKRWSNGKEGNLRALLSTLQYILGAESGWQPVPLTDLITAAAVKKAYRRATLCVHPDKLQQRGATVRQKYICEKVFDLLKEAWNKFNSEER